jgi:hypothetical protein
MTDGNRRQLRVGYQVRTHPRPGQQVGDQVSVTLRRSRSDVRAIRSTVIPPR